MCPASQCSWDILFSHQLHFCSHAPHTCNMLAGGAVVPLRGKAGQGVWLMHGGEPVLAPAVVPVACFPGMRHAGTEAAQSVCWACASICSLGRNSHPLLAPSLPRMPA